MRILTSCVIETADLEWEFPADPESTRSARRRVVEALGDLELEAAAESAALVVSELTANALLHARSHFVVRLVVPSLADKRSVVRIEVDDGSSRLPSVHNFTVTSTSGRGLRLVASISAAWGVELADGRPGKTVWAELPLDADALMPPPFSFPGVGPEGFNLDEVDAL